MMKKSLITLVTAAALGLAASSASASNINVGGVIWNPDSTSAYPSLDDFFSSSTVFENYATLANPTVTGYGIIDTINSSTNNQATFCPGCELTYKFTMTLTNITPIFGDIASFAFSNLAISVFVDHTPDYAGTLASASDGTLWLALAGRGDVTGFGSNIGTGSDTGTGEALLDVTGGLAAGNFDTNTKVNGTDAVMSSSFQPVKTQKGLLTGGLQLTGNSIPEPGTLALAGLGLLGLAARRRKV